MLVSVVYICCVLISEEPQNYLCMILYMNNHEIRVMNCRLDHALLVMAVQI